MAEQAETTAMAAALEAARRGPRGANPLVGAVILDADGRVRATGHHAGAGTPHAEAAALAALGTVPRDEAVRLTMFVTLEPCNHTGRTGPCAQAIVDAGIGRVVYATADGTDRASGGAHRLRAAGVDVRQGPLGAPARELNHRWFAARAAGRPFTTLHLAQTLDGRIAAADGSSQWITGAAARAHSHGVRAAAEAIIAGTGTVLADNPRLTARNPDGTPAARQPLRVIMGNRDVPADAAVCGDGNWRHLRTHDPAAALRDLAASGIDHAMVEGGSSIATAFLSADLVDELWLYQAPLLLGSGRNAVGDLGIGTLSSARRLRLDATGGPSHQLLGDDVVLHLEPLPHQEADSPAHTAPDGAEGRN
ncbi:bifunctional diaminohydroxyphosphoribosylaminopyrimidine deaminase/5-amino-6-(5-phosphoribosylamino)uracil reductase RibD [Arthrobacter sp. KK5.5]|uniref:bifunctional diaminohydroxyphosphoribosylaminopyrimidine deaminase/5-amino-6-(5-phosphoribosylamino)uracil reductase RibD n=1 Tax=Arthrobacter sp. KK5.5 TaxID=3373084 RepID=UPI003EE78087